MKNFYHNKNIKTQDDKKNPKQNNTQVIKPTNTNVSNKNIDTKTKINNKTSGKSNNNNKKKSLCIIDGNSMLYGSRY
jgi:hypothetical protein